MTLPTFHPHAGRATTLTRAMSGSGAAPHAERLADDGISDSEAQMLAKRLTRKKQKIELLEDEIGDLEAEVERLREMCQKSYSAILSVLVANDPDPQAYSNTTIDIPEESSLLHELKVTHDELKDALDRAEVQDG